VAEDTGAGTGDLAVTLHNATWSAGRMVGGHAATFNGTSSYASTDLTVDTTKSFSISAWVRLSDKSADRTIFSRDSGGNPSFILQYQKSTDEFVARMPNHATGDDAYWFDAESYSSPEIGVWYHLAAVYDAEQTSLTLYANGEPIGGASEVSAFNDPNGATWIGRGLDSWFAGDIADLQVWQRPIDPGDVVALSGPVQVADWEFDDGSGSTAADFSDYGNQGTLAGGTTWTTTGHTGTDPGALTFNGTSGTVTANQVVRTDQSYTVSACARLTSKADFATVVGQDGTHSSGFQFAYDKDSDCWAWELSVTDTNDPGQNVICQPGSTVSQHMGPLGRRLQRGDRDRLALHQRQPRRQRRRAGPAVERHRTDHHRPLAVGRATTPTGSPATSTPYTSTKACSRKTRFKTSQPADRTVGASPSSRTRASLAGVGLPNPISMAVRRTASRGAQLVRVVGDETALAGHDVLEPVKHGVQGVGEFPELVPRAGERDPLVQGCTWCKHFRRQRLALCATAWSGKVEQAAGSSQTSASGWPTVLAQLMPRPNTAGAPPSDASLDPMSAIGNDDIAWRAARIVR
jgi:hypothetical protein